MKVMGIGDPRTLELRLKSCELGVWRVASARAHAAERGRAPAASETSSILRELSRLRRELGEPQQDDQPVIVTGPTSVLAPLVRSATRMAVEEFAAAASAFIGNTSTVSPDRLRAALDTAHASTATLLALHRVEGAPVASEAA